MIGRTQRRPLLGLVALSLAALGGLGLASTSAGRADCPGRIICPVTGEMVCRDRCPAADPNRDECPGRIECPITGELVCRDLCPARGTVAESARTGSRPSCCQPEKA